MGLEIVSVQGRSVHVIARGQLKAEEYEAVRKKVREVAADAGKVNLLCVLQDFQGFDPNARWSEHSVPFGDEPALDKLAILGDPRWKGSALAFSVSGMRPRDVEFFPLEQRDEAFRWLGWS